LKDALNQCTAGEAHLAFSVAKIVALNSYGAYFRAAESTDHWPSRLSFADPTNEDGDGDGMKNPAAAARRYYAAFFAMLGRRDISVSLLDGTLTPAVLRETPGRVLGNQNYLAFSLTPESVLFAVNASYREPLRTDIASWLIRQDLLIALVEGNESTLTEIIETLSETPLPRNLENTVIRFNDGTLYLSQYEAVALAEVVLQR
jgi:hypothetical protein